MNMNKPFDAEPELKKVRDSDVYPLSHARAVDGGKNASSSALQSDESGRLMPIACVYAGPEIMTKKKRKGGFLSELFKRKRK